MSQEHHTTATGRTKFWRSNSIPEKPSWEPKRPILQQKPPKPVKRYTCPQHRQKAKRNRHICELRAKGKPVKQLAREFGLHPTRIRRILDANMTPEEILLDERSTELAYRREQPGEAERAAELRRSGMKFKDVAKTIGRSLLTTIKLLRSVIPAEELAAMAHQGKGHYRGKYKPDALPSSVRKRSSRVKRRNGARFNDPRPDREVVSHEVQGGKRFYTLSCGHATWDYASKKVCVWKRCGQCDQGSPADQGSPSRR